MKPNPFPLSHALEVMKTPARDAVFIGDSVSDVQAGIAAGITTVGYANKPAKPSLFKAAKAGAIVADMQDFLRHNG